MAARVQPAVPRSLSVGTFLLRRLARGLEGIGDQLTFFARALAGVPLAMRRFPAEVLRQIGEITWGAGALIVGAGTAGVIFVMSFITGALVGIEGFKSLELIGAQAFAGFVSAFGNTREITPIIAGVTLAAQVGAAFTAELGAMRISDEIDALDVMAMPTVTYLISTRVIAALVAVTPLYIIALLSSYFATEIAVVRIQGLSGGTFFHYFNLFLPPIDVFYSLIKAWTFATVVALIHCYYGFHAKGGPVGVGTAVGKAIRTSIVSVMVLDFALTAVMWGVHNTVSIAG